MIFASRLSCLATVCWWPLQQSQQLLQDSRNSITSSSITSSSIANSSITSSSSTSSSSIASNSIASSSSRMAQGTICSSSLLLLTLHKGRITANASSEAQPAAAATTAAMQAALPAEADLLGKEPVDSQLAGLQWQQNSLAWYNQLCYGNFCRRCWPRNRGRGSLNSPGWRSYDGHSLEHLKDQQTDGGRTD